MRQQPLRWRRHHASEARRPGSRSRAEGVSRAERGNDGSPSGARLAQRGSMRSTTARPAVLLGRGRHASGHEACRPLGVAARTRPPTQATTGKRSTQRRRREGRSGAAWSAVLKGRQAQRGGDGLTSRSPGGKRSAQARIAYPGRSLRHEAQRTKSAAPAASGSGVRDASPSDQFDAGATIACNCSITPGSTKTQGGLASIGRLNTWMNAWRLMCATRPVR